VRVLKLLGLGFLLMVIAASGAMLHASLARAAGDPPPLYTKSAGPGPMDLLSSVLDPNGLLTNPYSRYQYEHNALPNVDDLCKNGDCTSQQVTFDTATYGTWQHVACEAYHLKTATAFGSILGHANWFPVTYQGTVSWKGTSDNDGDNGVDLVPQFAPGTNTLSGLTTIHSQSIHMEFDNNESLARFSSKWWQSFIRSNHTIINGKQAIVIGLYGLDCEHDCLAELHPLYVLAVHIKSDANDDVWGIFVRRSGDEGYCSSGQMHDWNTKRVSLLLPGNGQATKAAGTEFYRERMNQGPKKVTPTMRQVDGGTLVTFDFAGGPMSDIFDGELHIKWTP
jgi:hypothetical protein